MENADFRPPTELTLLNWSPKICYWWLNPQWPTLLYKSWSKCGTCGQICEKKLIWLLLSFLGTYLQVRPINRFACLMAQMRQTHSRMCFLEFRLYCFPFHGSDPKKQFWGVNRHFQAKYTKYWHFHVIETTASIATKFCPMLETTKYSLAICHLWI